MYMHAHDLTPTIVGQYMTEAGLHVLMESGFDLKAVLDLAAVADEGYSEEMRTHARNVEHLLWKASFSPVNALLLDLKLGNVVMVPRVDGGSEKLSPRLIDFDGSFSRIMKAQNAPQDICVYTINTTLLLLSFVCETAKKYKLVDKKLYGAYALFAQQLRESFVRRVKAYKEFTDNDDVDTGAICELAPAHGRREHRRESRRRDNFDGCRHDGAASGDVLPPELGTRHAAMYRDREVGLRHAEGALASAREAFHDADRGPGRICNKRSGRE